MKRLLSILFLALFCAGLFAQGQKITSLTLDNGMNVLLCEDHAQHKIYGAICVHAGAKNDPADNTGMAHYLEHIMFKGTDQIGTTDWKQEKVYLDSISMLYDQIHGVTNKKIRNSTLLKINELSNKATQFAIPNEVDVILGKMGGEDVNAFTSNDVTVYLNQFPSSQLEKWLLVYKERFRNPIFRLFQSELEAVYEEYNMYRDEPMSVFMEDALAAAYGTHPYGRPVIGYPEHLKNPQPSAMQTFFNTYYQPNNMTLVLVGDFDAGAIQPLLNRILGQLRNEGEGAQPNPEKRMCTLLKQDIPAVKGRKVVTVSETPVKMGIIGFQTVGESHPDAIYLDMMSGLLNNESETGLLDILGHENKLMGAQSFNYAMLEAGVFACLYVPKILVQSHESAEELVLDAFAKIRNGEFSDDLFEAVKMDYLRDYMESMENLEDKFEVLLTLAGSGQMPDDYYKRGEIIRNLTKQDLVKIAQKYLNEDYLVFRSNMGKKKTEKLKKPAWKPIVAENTGKSSEFAMRIEGMPANDIELQVIDFQKDVTTIPLKGNHTLYVGKNPYNNIFSLEITYNMGTIVEPKLEEAVSYFNKQGGGTRSYNEFQLELQKMGATMDMTCTATSLIVSITGFDETLDKVLALCSEKLFSPTNDESALASIISDREVELKTNREDASHWGRALFSYARYGANSPYLKQMSLAELKACSGSDFLKIVSKALRKHADATFVGNVEAGKVADLIAAHKLITEKETKLERPFIPMRKYDEPTIFVASNKDFLQSNIFLFNAGQTFGQDTWAVCDVYNEYMGGGMASVIFQEIRELRSLGYSAYAECAYDRFARYPSFYYGYLGTQADKTVEGSEAMAELALTFPQRKEKFALAQSTIMEQKKSDCVDFRTLPGFVMDMTRQGFNNDPRPEYIQQIQVLTYDDLVKFYETNFPQKNLVITIAGDKKRMNIKELAKFGKVIEVDYKDFVRE